MSVANELITTQNFWNICRTCMSEGDLQPLFEDCSSDACLIEMFMSCTLVQFKQDDGLPEQVCINCVKEITSAFKFAKRCEYSDTTLRGCLKGTDNSKVVLNQMKNEENDGPPQVKKVKTRAKKKEIYETTKSEVILKIKAEDGIMDDDDDFIYQPQPVESLDYNDSIKDEYPGLNIDDLAISNEQSEDLTSDNYSNTGDKRKRSESSEVFNELDDEADDFNDQEDNDCNWSDDFEWNLDNADDKDNVAKRRRGALPKGPPYKCKRCNVKYDTLEELDEHRSTIKHPERRTHACPECDKVFTSSQLKGHLRSHTKERPYLCSHCGKGFSLNQNLRRHLMIHTGERPHKCHLCEKAFIQMVSLKDHLKTHTGETPYVCSVCGTGFKWSGQLKKHMLAKHAEEGDNTLKKEEINKSVESVHECPICHRQYNKKSILRTHMVIHGEKKFLCSYCGKGFFSIASLQAHSKVHTGVRPYTCQACGKSFSHIGSLKSHTLIHTGEKPFSCSVCNKAFTQRNHVKYHMRIHTGDRPYVCTVCGKTFALNGNLTVHMRTHTGETPFLCPICGKGFHDSSSMKKHKKGHTGHQQMQQQQIQQQHLSEIVI